MQMPPPVHGVTVMNERVASSAILAARFTLDVLPLSFARSIEDIGALAARKVIKAISTGVRLGHALVRDRPDVVYFTLCPNGFAFYRDCAYVAVMRALGVPRIYHLHNQGVAGEASGRLQHGLTRWAFQGAWVILLSPMLASGVASVVEPERIRYVANGVDDVTTHEQPRDAAEPIRLLYLSNMIREKGALVLVDALRILDQEGVAFDATFAGARFNDGCVEEFESTLARYGLEAKARYIGPVYGSPKDALFAAHDMFVFPSTYDAFPLVLLEAMRHALPVVSFGTGAIPEIVQDGATGLIATRSDARALADSLMTLVRDRSRLREMGRAGRARFETCYTTEHFERRLGDVLEEIVQLGLEQ